MISDGESGKFVGARDFSPVYVFGTEVNYEFEI